MSIDASTRGPATPTTLAPRAGGAFHERYAMIDAWRGLAALVVVFHHVSGHTVGHVGVMAFFVISGYCIAASADACQRKNLGFGRFMLRRAKRIYPPYLLAIAFFIATRFIKAATGGPNDLARFTPAQWLQNLTLTQWFTMVRDPQPSAWNNRTSMVTSFWSLGYEEQFYLLMGGLLALSLVARTPIWLAALAIAALGLAWNVAFPSICYGVFIEYWVHFVIGVMVFYRLSRFSTSASRRAVDLGLVAMLAGSGFMMWFAGRTWTTPWELDNSRDAYFEFFVCGLFALGLIALRPLDAAFDRAPWLRPLRWLGAVTFSLYLVHQFNIGLVHSVAAKIIPRSAPPWVHIPIELAGHVVVASIFWYLCERPFINKRLDPAPAPESPGGIAGEQTPPSNVRG